MNFDDVTADWGRRSSVGVDAMCRGASTGVPRRGSLRETTRQGSAPNMAAKVRRRPHSTDELGCHTPMEAGEPRRRSVHIAEADSPPKPPKPDRDLEFPMRRSQSEKMVKSKSIASIAGSTRGALLARTFGKRLSVRAKSRKSG